MSASGPVVSVVLPTYNRAATLRAAVDSVLSQSFADLELIVIDDGSTDDTAAVLASVHDERLRVLRQGSRLGAPAARNTGIDLACGRYVAFQDSDDVWRAGKLGSQVARFESAKSDVAVVYSAMLRHRVGGSVRIPNGDHPVVQGYLSTALAHENFIGLPTALVRSKHLRSVEGFDVRLPRFQDWDLWLRLSRAWRFEYIDEVTVDSEVTAGSITLDAAAYYAGLELVLAKHADLFSRVPRSAARFHLQLARNALSVRRPRAVYSELCSVWTVAGLGASRAITQALIERVITRRS